MANEKKRPSFLTGLKIETGQEKTDNIDRSVILDHYNFNDFNEIDNETLDFLKNKTFELHQTTAKMHTKLGNIFLEAQEKLAGHYEGTFEKWYTFLGYKKTNVYRLIGRSKLGRLYPDKIDNILLSLSYEISSQNCSDELREAVLDGTIKSLKEFKEHKALMYNNDSNTESINEMKDVTPITFESIDNNIKTYLHSVQKFDKDFIAKKDLSEEKLIAVNQKLEKAKKLLSDAWELIE